jgi:hypothetical protein
VALATGPAPATGGGVFTEFGFDPGLSSDGRNALLAATYRVGLGPFTEGLFLATSPSAVPLLPPTGLALLALSLLALGTIPAARSSGRLGGRRTPR